MAEGGAAGASEAARAEAATCSRCRETLPPGSRFCAACGAAVERRAGAERAIVRRQLTVVFCDLVDSVRLSTLLDPEDLTEIIRSFHDCVARVMAAHGGMVARRLGDGALVYFGYPQAGEDDPERAVRAALALIDAVGLLPATFEGPVQVRIGAATGIAIVGDVSGAGAADGLEVAGEAPNLAARLQGLAAPGTVLASDTLRALTLPLFEWRDLGRQALKGWREAVPVWQPLRPARPVSRFEARQRAGRVPMVGRAIAAERLTAFWQEARAGAGRAVLIRGEAGIGKSRLIAHLLEQVTGPHARLRYFCSPHQREAPLYPVVQQVEHAAGILDQDDADTKRRKLLASLGLLDERDQALIASLLMVPLPGHAAIEQMAAERRREQTLAALQRLSAKLAAVQPTLGLFEDAHWADPSSLELLELGARRIAELPALLAITARPEFRAPWLAEAGVEEITLDALDPAEAAALVQAAVPGASLPPETLREIVARADGVPLFLEELARSAAEAGGPLPTPTRAAPGRRNDDFAVPPTIHASLLARLDRLGESREVAEVAAAIGRVFGRDLLRRVTGLAEDFLEAALDKLLAGGLATPAGGAGPGQYRFRHALIRDTAYGSVVRARRRQLHARIAQALESELPEAATTRAQLLAHHYTEAGDPAQAAHWWLRAGLQSLTQSAVAEATVQFRRGLDQAGELPKGEARWRLELDLLAAYAKTLFASAGWAAEATAEVLARAQTLCDLLGDPPQRRAVLFGLWTQAFMRAEMATALRRGQEMLARGRSTKQPEWLLLGVYCTGMTQHSLGDFVGCEAHLGAGLASFEDGRANAYAGPVVSDPRVIMRTYLAWSQLCRGQFAAAAAGVERSITEARALGQVLASAHALYRHAYHEMVRAGPAAAVTALEALWPVVDEHGLSHYRSLGVVLYGWCVALTEDCRRGLAALRQGLADYRRHGNRLYLPSFWRMEAEALGAAGDIAEAIGRVEAAAALMQVTGELWDEAEILRVHGVLLAQAGEPTRAEAVLREAVTRAGSRDAGWFELRAATSLARLLTREGREHDAAGALAPVTARLSGAEHSLDLREALDLLRTLPATRA